MSNLAIGPDLFTGKILGRFQLQNDRHSVDVSMTGEKLADVVSGLRRQIETLNDAALNEAFDQELLALSRGGAA